MPWIRRPTYADRWHLRGDPPANAAARGLILAECGSTFSDDVLTWHEDGPPPERDRCAACQGAYGTQDGAADLDTRLRAAYIEGAEEHSLRTLGRGLTADELAGVLRRFPG